MSALIIKFDKSNNYYKPEFNYTAQYNVKDTNSLTSKQANIYKNPLKYSSYLQKYWQLEKDVGIIYIISKYLYIYY